jgi:hypothetical protein
MSILRSVTALVAGPALASAAAAQVPAAPFGAPPAPVVSSVPSVFSPLTPASPLIAPLPAAPDPLGIAPYPPPPGPTTTLWSFLGLSPAQVEYRQRALARTPLGQLRSRIQNPLSKLTGGLIPPFPPQTPTLAELQAPGPVGAAAKVKLDRMGAKDRIDAVHYLGSVDCTYWPEAEDAMVAALRVDRNEWVRLEAAKTLGKGCCCTKKTITALTMAATCSDADGNPSEKSPRVVAAAQQSLEHCLNEVCQIPAVMEAPVTPIPVPETPKELPKSGTEPAAWTKPGPDGGDRMAARPVGKEFYDRVVVRRPWPEIVAFARNGLMNAPPIPVEASGLDLEGSGGVYAAVPRRPDRPANLLDLLLGQDEPPAPPAAPATPATPQQTRPASQPPRPVQQAQQPPVPQPQQPPSQPRPVPAVAVRTPQAAPPTVQPASQPAPQPAPVVAVRTPQPQPQPPAEPSRIPASVSGGTPAPADRFAPKPVEVTMATTPAPAPVPTPVKPAPVKLTPAKPTQAAVPPQVARVLDLLRGPADPKDLAKEIELLSASDVAGYAPMAPMLIQTAEEVTDAPVRTACVRALVRGKANTPGVMAGLQQLTRDRSVEVRIEAAAGLSELKETK